MLRAGYARDKQATTITQTLYSLAWHGSAKCSESIRRRGHSTKWIDIIEMSLAAVRMASFLFYSFSMHFEFPLGRSGTYLFMILKLISPWHGMSQYWLLFIIASWLQTRQTILHRTKLYHFNSTRFDQSIIGHRHTHTHSCLPFSAWTLLMAKWRLWSGWFFDWNAMPEKHWPINTRFIDLPVIFSLNTKLPSHSRW